MSKIPQVLRENEQEILTEWTKDMTSATRRADLMSDQDFKQQSTRFLQLLQEAVQSGDVSDINASSFSQLRDFLGNLSVSRARQGFTPTDTAMFVFSLKKPVVSLLRRAMQANPTEMFTDMQALNDLVDKLGLFTAEKFMKSREEVIIRQQQEMLELSTPVVKLWDGILALPLDRHPGQRAHAGGDGEPAAAIRRNRFRDRDHRHHRRAHGGHAGGAASDEDGGGGAADGRGLHHQRQSSADRADYRAPGSRSGRCHHQSDPGGRFRAGADGGLGQKRCIGATAARTETEWNGFRF